MLHDGERIFAARIVGSQKYQIAASPAASPMSGRLLLSRSPPQPKTVITRPEFPARAQSRGPAPKIAQRVIGVGVIDDDRERLPAIDPLKSARNADKSPFL